MINKMSYVCLILHLILTIFLQFIKVNCMINGIVTTSSEFPSTVLVKFNSSFYCGGSIISSKYVLTSGVCGSNKERLEGIGVNFVDLFKHSTGEIIPVEKIFIHPHFKMGNKTAINDISIIKLIKEIEFNDHLTTIPVYSEPLIIGLHCETAGWGMVNDGLLTRQSVYQPWPAENVLRKSTQVIVDIKRCQELIDKDIFIKLSRETHICARGFREKEGPAFGDFGGPLICKNKQAAITTNSLFDPRTKHLYTVYTPMFSNLGWINGVIIHGNNYSNLEVYGKKRFMEDLSQTSYQNALVINNMIFIIIPILQVHISLLIINFTLSFMWKVSTLTLLLISIYKHSNKHTSHL